MLILGLKGLSSYFLHSHVNLSFFTSIFLLSTGATQSSITRGM